MLQPHTLKPAHGSTHRVKRVGRGNASGHGTYSTRGGKGQTARSGGSRGLARLAFRRLMQSTPKLRGFKSLSTKPREVYLSDLEKHFAAGETVSLEALRTKNLLKEGEASAKIISTGILTKKLNFVGLPATKGAVEKIKAVGGEIK